MDVDQSFLPTPFPVKAAIFESFSRQNMSESEIDITTSIKQFVKTTYGFPFGIDFTYADSSLTLFNKMVLCCIQEGGTLCFPVGTNGSYVYSAKFLKAKIVNIPTKSEEGFKLTENALNQVLNNVKTPWVYISGPTINPTGRVYDQKEIENLLTTCAKFGARVMIDTSFSGLEFDYEGWGGWNLEGVLSRLYLSSSSFSVCLLGELSSMMLTGALKFGFLALNQLPLIDLFHSFSGLSRPHSTVKYAIKKLLGLREKKSEEMWGAVTRQIKDLRSRSRRLEEVTIKFLLTIYYFFWFDPDARNVLFY